MIRQLTTVSLILGFVSTLSTLAGTWRDDFEDGNLDDWIIGAGRWNVEQGKLSCIDKGSVSMIWMEPSKWRDYTFEASVCVVERFFVGNHEMSLCVRTNPQDLRCYGFALQFAGGNYASDQLQINRILGGAFNVTHFVRKDYEILDNVWYRLKGSVIGDRLNFYVNNELHLQLDLENPMLESGTVAMYVSGAHILIDDVVIIGDDVPDGGSLPVIVNVKAHGKLTATWAGIKSN